MNAIDFLPNTPKVHFQLPKTTKMADETPHITQALIAFLSMEISDTLYALNKHGYISSKGLEWFDKLACKDFDTMEDFSKKHRNIGIQDEDNAMFVGLFDAMADRHLSAFQKASVPQLSAWLSVIYQIRYIDFAMPMLVRHFRQLKDDKVLVFLNEKRKELEQLFLKHYTQVSNQPFRFDQCYKVFGKIQTLTYDGFKELSERYRNVES